MRQEMNQMKGEVIKEVKKSKKKKKFKVVCSVIFLLCVVGVLLLVSWVVAATGLVTIPVISNIAYNEPVPTRVVEPGVPAEVIAEETLKTTLIKRIQANQGKLSDTSVTLEIKEESLTASLQSAIKQSQSPVLISDNAQVIVNSDTGFELFLPAMIASRKTALQLHVDTQVVDDKLGVKIDRLSIGSLNVPGSLISFVLQPIVDSQLSQVNQALGSFATVNGIVYFDGCVKIGGEFNVEIEQSN